MSEAPAVCAALVTPVDSTGNIDTRRQAAHSRWVLDNGCDGIVLFGTTGESASFGLAQRRSALESLLANGIAPASVIVGSGCCSVEDTVQLTQHAIDAGCHGVLVHPPFFFPAPDDDGIYDYFARVIGQLNGLGRQIYLYHFPEMTGAPINAALIDKLLRDFPDVIAGIKDSTGSLDNMVGLARQFPALKVYSGDDNLLWPLLEAGGYGAITATANITPNLLADIKTGWQQNSAAAQQAQEVLVGLWEETLLTFPVSEATKALIAAISADPEWANVCAPLRPLDTARRDQLLSMTEKFRQFIPDNLGKA